ncbi:hypothetical protein DCC81_01825 [Chitinophaga parva]|uniref:Competence protein ComEC n=1 Tax=Chitinophaga parva TaxID=2169414 RepID=A0A2T7BKP6_9BACT|nr:hypothetical protein DCC81_01825 [Chitinophaga parva]
MFVTTFCKKAPFVRLLLPWILGLLWQWHFPGMHGYQVFTAVLLCALLLGFRYLPLSRQYFLAPLQGLFLFVLVIQTASYVAWRNDVRNNAGWFGRNAPAPLQLVIDAPVQQRPYGFRTTARVVAQYTTQGWQPACGEVQLYAKPAASLHPGDRLVCTDSLQRIQNSGNPGAFDIAGYMAGQHIFHQVWLTPAHTWVVGRTPMPLWQRILAACRQYCVRTFQRYVPSPREAGLAEALLIGYKDDLDKLLVQDYTQAGVVHIIAISGMHLLLLYEALLWLLQALPEKRWSRAVKAALMLAVLWGFALLTGGAASVLRATLMYTFITVERLVVQRYTNRYNLLAASAFLLLCYQPRLLLDVGFQLSYLAVLSLMLFQRGIARLYVPNSRAGRFAWNMTTATLAAQVLTVPVSIYYFHQFPNFFLLANLVAIALSELAMYACILLLAVGWVPLLARATGYALYGLLYAMNTWVQWIGHLPYAVSNGLYLGGWEVALLYAGLLAVATWLLLQYRQAFRWALVCVAMVALLHVARLWQAGRQQLMVVYNIRRHTAIDLVQGRHVTFAGDTDLLQGGGLQQYLLPARLPLQITGQQNLAPAQLVSFAGHRLVIVNAPLPDIWPVKKCKTDYILLSHDPQVDIRQLLQHFDAGRFIFDASCSPAKIRKWKSDCEALTLRFFSVPEQGAFIQNF